MPKQTPWYETRWSLHSPTPNKNKAINRRIRDLDMKATNISYHLTHDLTSHQHNPNPEWSRILRDHLRANTTDYNINDKILTRCGLAFYWWPHRAKYNRHARRHLGLPKFTYGQYDGNPTPRGPLPLDAQGDFMWGGYFYRHMWKLDDVLNWRAEGSDTIRSLLFELTRDYAREHIATRIQDNIKDRYWDVIYMDRFTTNEGIVVNQWLADEELLNAQFEIQKKRNHT